MCGVGQRGGVTSPNSHDLLGSIACSISNVVAATTCFHTQFLMSSPAYADITVFGKQLVGFG